MYLKTMIKKYDLRGMTKLPGWPIATGYNSFKAGKSAGLAVKNGSGA